MSLELVKVIYFYCKNENVRYQQGMLDILLPFIMLHSRNFRLAEVYGSFKSTPQINPIAFMSTCIYNTLLSKSTGTETWLPHLKLSLKLILLLLKYHDIELFSHLGKENIELETFAVPWILLNFYRGISFELTFHLTQVNWFP